MISKSRGKRRRCRVPSACSECDVVIDKGDYYVRFTIKRSQHEWGVHRLCADCASLLEPDDLFPDKFPVENLWEEAVKRLKEVRTDERGHLDESCGLWGLSDKAREKMRAHFNFR